MSRVPIRLALDVNSARKGDEVSLWELAKIRNSGTCMHHQLGHCSSSTSRGHPSFVDGARLAADACQAGEYKINRLIERWRAEQLEIFCFAQPVDT